ncbi:hypothetical protein LPE01_30490 [Lactiplantibacillus pentosus]|nr:hypothetical protein LPE01_30490 [Lactiplantibacillus pentosus]
MGPKFPRFKDNRPIRSSRLLHKLKPTKSIMDISQSWDGNDDELMFFDGLKRAKVIDNFDTDRRARQAMPSD